MNKNHFILVSIFCTQLVQFSHAQLSQRIIDLHAKVKQLENHQADTAKVVFRKRCSDRKYSIKTKLQADSIISQHKIKYFRSGVSKERIKHYKISPKNRVLFVHVVKMNGKAIYIKLCETSINFKRELGIVKEEVLIDNKYYQVRTYDRYGILVSSENIIISGDNN